MELDARGRRLRAAVAAVLVPVNTLELRLMHDWLDSWPGLGLIVAGMTHQGWDVELTGDGDVRPRSAPARATGRIATITAEDRLPKNEARRVDEDDYVSRH